VLDPSFVDDRYQGHTLVITSESKEEDLKKLDEVEQPDSEVRILFAVNELKEGWDVKNVYVIVSMRASVSTILTEQTLGRGLRLSFGRYTGIQLLDTLAVLAHERCEQLLKPQGHLREVHRPPHRAHRRAQRRR
jgi:type III restriction enzyme